MRTRFPPSPTGFLHVGSLRTALYCYLLAKQTKDKFFLRIEDTDQQRSVPGAIENIVKTLHWAGLDPDEGVMFKNGVIVQEGSRGPYIQSERLPLYKKYAQELLEKGHAYPCFCTTERLDQMRKAQEARKVPPMYDRTCLKLSKEEVDRRVAAGEPHVIRLKIPHERTISFDDDIRGVVTFKAMLIDDQVLLKSDGYPTYHLAHVVDDHLMETDLVLRGEEWLSSLPKHILLFEFFGWTAPRYAHVPLLLNQDKTKLSKRQGDVAVEEYIAKGYLPEALLNFLALLGWNPGTTQEIFSLAELIDAFNLERVQKAGAIFDLEKLHWLQGQWMRKIPKQEFAERCRAFVSEKFHAAKSDPDFERKALLIQERITFFSEAPEMLGFFYEEPSPKLDLLANSKQKVAKDDVKPILALLITTLQPIKSIEWSDDTLKDSIEQSIAKGSFKRGQLLWVLRAALTGREFSPGAYEVATVLGKDETVKRLHNASRLIA